MKMHDIVSFAKSEGYNFSKNQELALFLYYIRKSVVFTEDVLSIQTMEDICKNYIDYTKEWKKD